MFAIRISILTNTFVFVVAPAAMPAKYAISHNFAVAVAALTNPGMTERKVLNNRIRKLGFSVATREDEPRNCEPAATINVQFSCNKC